MLSSHRAATLGGGLQAKPSLPRQAATFGVGPRQLLLAAAPCQGRRVLAVGVFTKKDISDSDAEGAEWNGASSELQVYRERERFLMGELAASRALIDKLLDQQQPLISLVSRLAEPSARGEAPAAGARSSPLSTSWSPELLAAASAAPSTSSGAPARSAGAARPPATTAAAVTAATAAAITSAVQSAGAGSSAGGSLASLFGSTAASASGSDPAAAAAASIAAALSAVQSGGDILKIDSFDLSRPASSTPTPTPASASASPAAPSSDAPARPQPTPIFDTLAGFMVGTQDSASASATSSEAAASEGKDLSSLLRSAQSEASDVPAYEGPVEVPKAAPTDPPPDLVLGDDDIYWVARLHAGLEDRGFFPGYEELENWFFGEGTHMAVLAFQASEHLPETGVVDRPTWAALLGQDVTDELYARAGSAAASSSSSRGAAGVAPKPEPMASTGSTEGGEEDEDEEDELDGHASPARREASNAATGRWPVLMEGDGGKEVHALQVALSNAGFHPSDDDMRWWQFGDTTNNALRYFQGCSGLPESGVADERTWRALLGPDAQPSDMFSLKLEKQANSDDEDNGFEADMDGVTKGRVWLIGEQRWEKK
ncbi:hypothetical protein HYH03_007270 [Edaphochlamys debaryana]|uniref:Peptidoglycan binding-like domain-containing protein n=1 Tax=Edaphochlamys debaryana TaxID=47281 RepID=A0A836BZ77_9CHLO|nr:hypothetical protein HYH03_007270 [Edaphochlamys debaryana]|eukprot:KAG2494501.1 hypothetical protein HYH03_007270 [Edaphochlamys debaryana]